MQPYNFTIKDYDKGEIVLEQSGKKVTVRMDQFVSDFYLYRNFPFSGCILPRVVAYSSPVFIYNDRPHAFLITQMRPTINNEVYCPWSYLLTFVDLNLATFVEHVLFFGSGQIFSEDMHLLHVPELPSSELGPSELLTFIGLENLPVFVRVSKDVYYGTTFGPKINTIFQSMRRDFVSLSPELNFVRPEDILPETTDEEIAARFLSYYSQDKVLRMGELDDFANKVHSDGVSFSELISTYLGASK